MEWKISIDEAIRLANLGTTYVLGKKIASTNAIALLRIIKQTTKYTSKVKQNDTKTVVEITSKNFPKITIYVSKNLVKPPKQKTNNPLEEAYIPRRTKKYKKTKKQ